MLEQRIEQLSGSANDIADLAGQTIREAAGDKRQPMAKSDASPVTETDRLVEQCLRERIADRFPDHGVLGEEFGAEGLDKEFVWVIDPIDGTKAFIGGLPVYCTLISLTRGGTPVLGLVDKSNDGRPLARRVGSDNYPQRHTNQNGSDHCSRNSLYGEW